MSRITLCGVAGRSPSIFREDRRVPLWRDAGLRVRIGFAGAIICIFAVLCAPAPAGEELSAEMLLPDHDGKDAYFPAAACGSERFLVVWQAGRIAEGTLVWGKGEPVGAGDIVACRVDKAGRTPDARPFVVSGAPDLQEKPRVAYGRKVFLAVWQDLRNGRDYDVYAARLAPDPAGAGQAAVLDPEGILIAGGPHNQANPCVAYDGSTFLVAWQDFKSGKYAIRGARVSGEGQLLDAEGIALGDSGRSDFHRFAPAASSQGDGRTVVFWVSGSTRPGQGEPSGGCFIRDGKVEKSFPFKGHHYAAPVNPVAVAAGPKGCLVAWRNNAAVGRGTPSRNANAAFFGPEGEKEPSDEKGTRGAFRLAGGNIADPAIAWDGARFVAAWHEAKGEKKSFPSDVVRLATVSADGIPSGQALDVSGTRESPACGAAAASDGAGTTIIAYEKHPSTSDVPVKVGYRILGTRERAGTSRESEGFLHCARQTIAGLQRKGERYGMRTMGLSVTAFLFAGTALASEGAAPPSGHRDFEYTKLDNTFLVEWACFSGVVGWLDGPGREGMGGQMGGSSTQGCLRGMGSDKAGNLYMCDMMGGMIRALRKRDGMLLTLSGNGHMTAGRPPEKEGPAYGLSLDQMVYIAAVGEPLEGKGSLYITTENQVLRLFRNEKEDNMWWCERVAGGGKTVMTGSREYDALGANLREPRVISTRDGRIAVTRVVGGGNDKRQMLYWLKEGKLVPAYDEDAVKAAAGGYFSCYGLDGAGNFAGCVGSTIVTVAPDGKTVKRSVKTPFTPVWGVYPDSLKERWFIKSMDHYTITRVTPDGTTETLKSNGSWHAHAASDGGRDYNIGDGVQWMWCLPLQDGRMVGWNSHGCLPLFVGAWIGEGK